MLDAFIIEQIRKKEQRESEREERPQPTLDVPPMRYYPESREENERQPKDSEKGSRVIIIDL